MKSLIVVFSLFQYLILSKCDDYQCTKANQRFYDPYKDPDGVCVLGCQAGCYCERGFMMNEDTQECTPEGDIGAYECRKHEYLGCGDGMCANFCGSTRDPVCNLSRLSCGYDCFCKPGFIKVPNHQCIPVEDCPQYFFRE